MTASEMVNQIMLLPNVESLFVTCSEWFYDSSAQIAQTIKIHNVAILLLNINSLKAEFGCFSSLFHSKSHFGSRWSKAR